MLWDEASTVTFHRGSHQLDLPHVEASNGLWEVFDQKSELERGKAASFKFQRGGLYVRYDPV